jgi:hypothetical protein
MNTAGIVVASVIAISMAAVRFRRGQLGVDLTEPLRSFGPVAAVMTSSLALATAPPHEPAHRRGRRLPARLGRLLGREGDLVSADAEIGEVTGRHAGTADEAGSREHDEPVLAVRSERNRRPAGPKVAVDAGLVGVSPTGRRNTGELSDHVGGDRDVELDPWKVGVVLEG